MITLKRDIVYSLIILTAIFSISYGVQYFTLHPTEKNDIYIFREAANGNYNVTNSGAGWIYKDYLSFAFKPLLWFNETTSFIVFSWLSTLSFLILSKMIMRNKYGWIIIIALLPLFKQAIQSCNTSVILALLVVNPFTSLVAVLFKPHFVVFPILHSFLLYYRTYRSRTDFEGTESITANTSNYNFRKI